MDIVTYALLKKKIDDIVSGYVTDDEMAEAISLAVQNLVTTGQMTVAIDNAVANRPTNTQMNNAINNATSNLVETSEMTTAIANAVADLVNTTEMNASITNAVDAIMAGFSYKGTVATISALPSSGNTKGDCYTVDENLGTYVWDGNKWFEYNVNLDLILQSGTEETAKYHLGFYIDSDGDVAQTNN